MVMHIQDETTVGTFEKTVRGMIMAVPLGALLNTFRGLRLT